MELPEDMQQCRQEIDRLDDDILNILNERSQYVIKIGHLKKQQDSSAHLHTPGREVAIVERLMRKNPGPFPSEALASCLPGNYVGVPLSRGNTNGRVFRTSCHVYASGCHAEVRGIGRLCVGQ